MKKKVLRKVVPLMIVSSLLFSGCTTTQTTSSPEQVVKATSEVKVDKKVYKGKVVGKSNKAKSISISVGKGDKAKTIMVKFDDKTKGVEHAAKGHASIIHYEMRDAQPWATVIKPKLAKLPKGVSEIKTEELKALMAKKADFMLIDARPGKRYAASHISGAVSLGVAAYKDKAASVLPKDKDKLLIFYCGGPT